jgi:hypothetical protein
MKKKMRKFVGGGETDSPQSFSPEQEKWLGGADRTDPYILARMRSAVPDAPEPTSRDFDAIDKDMVAPSRNLEPVTKTVSKSKVSVTKPKSSWEGNDKISPMPETPEEYKARNEAMIKKQALINVDPTDITPFGAARSLFKSGLKNLLKKDLKTYTPSEMEAMIPKLGRKEPLKLGMKKGGSVKKMASGGKVSSASKRADGCCVKGKTRGRMV